MSSGSSTWSPLPLEDVTEDGVHVEDIPVTEVPHQDVCLSSGSCSGRCGGGSDDDCWCDQECVPRGDCCCDIENICSESPESLAFTNITESTLSASSALASTEQVTHSPTQEDLVTSSSSSVPISTSSNDYTAANKDSTLTFDLSASTLSEPECQCRTNDLGPVKRGCCTFPFTYAGAEHQTCVEVDSCQSWCATELDPQGHYIPDMWGFCDDSCYFDTPTPSTVTEIVTKPSNVTEEGVITSPSVSTALSSSTLTETSTVSDIPMTDELGTRRPFKPSNEFFESLPPRHTPVVIHEDLHDPVRVSTFH